MTNGFCRLIGKRWCWGGDGGGGAGAGEDVDHRKEYTAKRKEKERKKIEKCERKIKKHYRRKDTKRGEEMPVQEEGGVNTATKSQSGGKRKTKNGNAITSL